MSGILRSGDLTRSSADRVSFVGELRASANFVDLPKCWCWTPKRQRIRTIIERKWVPWSSSSGSVVEEFGIGVNCESRVMERRASNIAYTWVRRPVEEYWPLGMETIYNTALNAGAVVDSLTLWWEMSLELRSGSIKKNAVNWDSAVQENAEAFRPFSKIGKPSWYVQVGLRIPSLITLPWGNFQTWQDHVCRLRSDVKILIERYIGAAKITWTYHIRIQVLLGRCRWVYIRPWIFNNLDEKLWNTDRYQLDSEADYRVQLVTIYVDAVRVGHAQRNIAEERIRQPFFNLKYLHEPWWDTWR
jgi:hypothetical protein